MVSTAASTAGELMVESGPEAPISVEAVITLLKLSGVIDANSRPPKSPLTVAGERAEIVDADGVPTLKSLPKLLDTALRML